MSAAALWTAVVAGSLGCYLVKLAGLSVPDRVLEDPRVRRVAAMLPVALLAALVAVQTVADGTRLVLDARLAGVGVAVLAVALRAPFLVVVLAAMLSTALLRL
ncbi:AzlD domain-containing protein [Egicoccus halophilus]|uniref:Branched-chain amino acid transporter AzlD n=1 Tax=Egicoccus halophilus TaxID=1670830 RepID=A0A8J3AIC8_9ACTN|nr:AzlD domain-containing protein [Egicoccus halophilus]GGI09642.1 branched-chain amino acid transporter AzlD [Egicoccus halophilus]